jgi:putative ATPase
MDLFDSTAPLPSLPEPAADAPLAERMRPTTLDAFVGQDDVTREGGLIRGAIARGSLPSLILWGPPGTGKTTLARILARHIDLAFVAFSAVMGGVKQVREIVKDAKTRRLHGRGRTILFVDEIHRFNKAQQDAFLPHVEDGTIILVGATTENPSFELNAALLSRAQVIVLKPLGKSHVIELLRLALSDSERGLGALGIDADDDALDVLARLSQGDVRLALNLLEASAALVANQDEKRLDTDVLKRAMAGSPLRYDKGGDEHYNVISAFIKSMRGSDPDASVYWLARMIAGGESARFIARRMVVFASEDVGNADPSALEVALNVAKAVELVGLPEARINLSQGVVYLSLAPKSNASYAAINAASEVVKASGPLPVPLHLRNAPTGLMKELGYGQGYEYAHNHSGGISGQRHLPEELGDVRFYEPTQRGFEAELRARLERLRKTRQPDGQDRP